MKIFNTLTRHKDEFHPINEGKVGIYVCGPTVYDYIHIGNARPMIVFDTLRRYFEYKGYEVNYVSNFTDVDDKIIKRANEEGVDASVISERYIAECKKDMAALHVEEATTHPQATKEIPDMIAMVETLIEKGYAYEVNGDVYFAVDSDDKYGELSHQRTDDLMAGARIEENDQKHNPLDFALWKKTEKGIKWDSPWGPGRPGWHTECVVMIGKEFNKPLIDIHGGGKDLKFPHHENEVAQAECHSHTHLANYWIHNGMLETKGGKMSKSLGNTMWAKDVIAEHGSNLIRWFLLSARYRDSLIYDDETFNAAKTELGKIENALKQAELKAILADQSFSDAYDEDKFAQFMSCMSDDLNTPNAYTVIFDTVKLLNQSLRTRDVDFVKLGLYYRAVKKMLQILGIFVDELNLSEQDRELYSAWDKAKKEKDFVKADEYRAELAKKGIL